MDQLLCFGPEVQSSKAGSEPKPGEPSKLSATQKLLKPFHTSFTPEPRWSDGSHPNSLTHFPHGRLNSAFISPEDPNPSIPSGWKLLVLMFTFC